jgi:hypothetical protein
MERHQGRQSRDPSDALIADEFGSGNVDENESNMS